MSCISVSVFSGRLTTDPELKSSTSGKPVCTFKIAVERGYGEQKRTYFPTLVAWNGYATFVSKLAKGTKITARCEYTERNYKDKQGNKRNVVEFLVQEIEAEPKRSQSQDDSSIPSYSGSESGFEDLSSDDELPF
ncbi:MAG: hypothetical protein A2Y15_05980 [Clostridiales bacterium GWF2_36_10]|nr:MAG: hypothetical protein A2Y15_05980 [Clostridiales bacterium GWF2_36_10]HAN21593.1 hypothetical protein [Clostridiales bacterium]